MKKHFLCLLFTGIFTLIVISGSFCNPTAAWGEAPVDYALAKYLANQDMSNEVYNRLLQSFTEEGKYDLEAHYPDYYAGAYIGDNGNLIIFTKNPSEDDLIELKQICGDNAYVLQPAKHSYNELISAKHEIFERSQKIRNEKLFDCNMITISIRDNYNKVFIGIPTLEDNRVAKYLTDGIDFSLHEFYIASPPQQFGNYHPGDCIHGNIGGSTGYKAKLTIDGVEKIGFVTAAHVTNGSNAYTNWTHLVKIGNTIVEQNSGSVDAAFVELTGSHTFANQIDGYNITAGTSVIPAIGSTVYKIGTTTGTTSGTVISNINESWWDIDGVLVLFTNLCDTTVYCEGGDSGGLMYTKNGTTYKVIGNIKGGGNGVYSATKHSYLPWNISVIS